MDNKVTVKEFRGDESFWMLMTNEEIYVNVQDEKKSELIARLEKSQKEVLPTENIIHIKISDIKEIVSKKRSRTIDITTKSDNFVMFDAESKEIRNSVLEEIHNLLGESYELKEKKYSMFRRVITPGCYTLFAAGAGALAVWLASEQPVLVKRDMLVKKSVATIIETLQFIEGVGVQNAIIGATVLIVVPIIYMALRIVKPPVKIIIEER